MSNKKYDRLFEQGEKGLNMIDLSQKELKALGFKYDKGNNLFYYRNEETKQDLHYVVDVCNFWSYRNYYLDSVYPYTIEDVKLLKKAIDEGYVYDPQED